MYICTYVHRCTHTNVSISEQGKAGLSHESDRAADTLHVKLQTESWESVAMVWRRTVSMCHTWSLNEEKTYIIIIYVYLYNYIKLILIHSAHRATKCCMTLS